MSVPPSSSSSAVPRMEFGSTTIRRPTHTQSIALRTQPNSFPHNNNKDAGYKSTLAGPYSSVNASTSPYPPYPTAPLTARVSVSAAAATPPPANPAAVNAAFTSPRRAHHTARPSSAYSLRHPLHGAAHHRPILSDEALTDRYLPRPLSAATPAGAATMDVEGKVNEIPYTFASHIYPAPPDDPDVLAQSPSYAALHQASAAIIHPPPLEVRTKEKSASRLASGGGQRFKEAPLQFKPHLNTNYEHIDPRLARAPPPREFMNSPAYFHFLGNQETRAQQEEEEQNSNTTGSASAKQKRKGAKRSVAQQAGLIPFVPSIPYPARYAATGASVPAPPLSARETPLSTTSQPVSVTNTSLSVNHPAANLITTHSQNASAVGATTLSTVRLTSALGLHQSTLDCLQILHQLKHSLDVNFEAVRIEELERRRKEERIRQKRVLKAREQRMIEEAQKQQQQQQLLLPAPPPMQYIQAGHISIPNTPNVTSTTIALLMASPRSSLTVPTGAANPSPQTTVQSQQPYSNAFASAVPPVTPHPQSSFTAASPSTPAAFPSATPAGASTFPTFLTDEEMTSHALSNFSQTERKKMFGGMYAHHPTDAHLHSAAVQSSPSSQQPSPAGSPSPSIDPDLEESDHVSPTDADTLESEVEATGTETYPIPDARDDDHFEQKEQPFDRRDLDSERPITRAEMRARKVLKAGAKRVDENQTDALPEVVEFTPHMMEAFHTSVQEWGKFLLEVREQEEVHQRTNPDKPHLSMFQPQLLQVIFDLSQKFTSLIRFAMNSRAFRSTDDQQQQQQQQHILPSLMESVWKLNMLIIESLLVRRQAIDGDENEIASRVQENDLRNAAKKLAELRDAIAAAEATLGEKGVSKDTSRRASVTTNTGAATPSVGESAVPAAMSELMQKVGEQNAANEAANAELAKAMQELNFNDKQLKKDAAAAKAQKGVDLAAIALAKAAAQAEAVAKPSPEVPEEQPAVANITITTSAAPDTTASSTALVPLGAPVTETKLVPHTGSTAGGGAVVALLTAEMIAAESAAFNPANPRHLEMFKSSLPSYTAALPSVTSSSAAYDIQMALHLQQQEDKIKNTGLFSSNLMIQRDSLLKSQEKLLRENEYLKLHLKEAKKQISYLQENQEIEIRALAQTGEDTVGVALDELDDWMEEALDARKTQIMAVGRVTDFAWEWRSKHAASVSAEANAEASHQESLDTLRRLIAKEKDLVEQRRLELELKEKEAHAKATERAKAFAVLERELSNVDTLTDEELSSRLAHITDVDTLRLLAHKLLFTKVKKALHETPSQRLARIRKENTPKLLKGVMLRGGKNLGPDRLMGLKNLARLILEIYASKLLADDNEAREQKDRDALMIKAATGKDMSELSLSGGGAASTPGLDRPASASSSATTSRRDRRAAAALAEKIAGSSKSDSTTTAGDRSLATFVYQFFFHRYGLKMMAETNFCEMLRSILVFLHPEKRVYSNYAPIISMNTEALQDKNARLRLAFFQRLLSLFTESPLGQEVLEFFLYAFKMVHEACVQSIPASFGQKELTKEQSMDSAKVMMRSMEMACVGINMNAGSDLKSKRASKRASTEGLGGALTRSFSPNARQEKLDDVDSGSLSLYVPLFLALESMAHTFKQLGYSDEAMDHALCYLETCYIYPANPKMMTNDPNRMKILLKQMMVRQMIRTAGVGTQLAFERFDTDRSGVVNFEKFRALVDLDKDASYTLASLMDSENPQGLLGFTGGLTLSDFQSALNPDQRLCISLDVLLESCTLRWHEEHTTLTAKYADAFKVVDTSGHGLINFLEFYLLVQTLDISKTITRPAAAKIFREGKELDGKNDAVRKAAEEAAAAALAKKKKKAKPIVIPPPPPLVGGGDAGSAGQTVERVDALSPKSGEDVTSPKSGDSDSGNNGNESFSFSGASKRNVSFADKDKDATSTTKKADDKSPTSPPLGPMGASSKLNRQISIRENEFITMETCLVLFRKYRIGLPPRKPYQEFRAFLRRVKHHANNAAANDDTLAVTTTDSSVTAAAASEASVIASTELPSSALEATSSSSSSGPSVPLPPSGTERLIPLLHHHARRVSSIPEEA